MSNEITKETAQQIVDTVKDVCGRNINFIGADGRIIASTDPARIDTFHEIGRRTVQTGETMEVTEDEEYMGSRKGINFPIVYGGRPIAAIGISGEPEDVQKYAYLAQKIAALLLRERELERKESNRRSRMNYFLRFLIGKGPAPEDAERFIKSAGGGNFCTIVVRAAAEENPGNLYRLETKIFQTFAACGSELYTFEYPAEYILILRERDYRRKWPDLQTLAEEAKGTLRIGTGGMARFSEQKTSYRQAGMVLKSLHGGCHAAAFEDLDIELLLGAVPEELREAYLKKVVGGLKPEEARLLEVYFEENQSLIRASDRLGIHKNTLQYRLDRIAQTTGYNPREFRQAAVLYNAVRMKSMI